MRSDYYGCKIRRVRREDSFPVEWFAARMREMDKLECVYTGDHPALAARFSIDASPDDCWEAVGKDGLPFMLFGYSPMNRSIWALGTEDAARYPRVIVAAGRDFIASVIETYGYAMNYISLENKKALRFIEKAGAVFTAEANIHGHAFVQFELKRKEEL